MVVAPCDTSLANAAVFAPRRFVELASAAGPSRVVENLVVWIVPHLLPMVFLGDESFASNLCAEVGEKVR